MQEQPENAINQPSHPPQSVSTPPTGQNSNPGFYKPEEPAVPVEVIEWDAAEYASHDKELTWYGVMVLGSIIIAAVVYLFNRDIFTSIIVLFALIGIVYASGRKTRNLHYSLDSGGIQVDNKYYAFHDFRNFSVSEEGATNGIILIPLKRFVPAINIFVPAELEDRVVGKIAQILPMEQHKVDVIEKMMRRLKF